MTIQGKIESVISKMTGEDIEIIRVEDNVSVKVVGSNKKIESNISLKKQ